VIHHLWSLFVVWVFVMWVFSTLAHGVNTDAWWCSVLRVLVVEALLVLLGLGVWHGTGVILQ
jgi:hypothetical protein